MKTLLILRHGKSAWSDPELTDHDRPLKNRGLRDAPRMGRLARDAGLVPERILTSTAVRARHTAELFAEACGHEGPVHAVPEMYHADPADYVAAVRRFGGDASRVLIVGHNPGLEVLFDRLTGEGSTFPTAAMGVVALEIASWLELTPETQGRQVAFWLPRELE